MEIESQSNILNIQIKKVDALSIENEGLRIDLDQVMKHKDELTTNYDNCNAHKVELKEKVFETT